MSTREMVYNIIDEFNDEQLEQVLNMLNSIKKMIDYEREDDEYCEKLLQNYIDDNSPDKHKTVSIEELADELGIDL